MLLYLFLQKFRPEVLASSRQVVFILLMMSVTVLVALLVRKVARLDLYMVPFCLMPVVVRSFFDTRVALFTFLLALIMVAFHAPNSYEFMFLELTAGIMALFTLADMHHRSRLFLSLIIVFCTYAIGLMGMTAMHEGTLAELDLRTLGYLGASVGLTLLAYPLIFLSEKVFGFVSDLTLLELSNSNHPLLRRLAAEAPGTFQHSLQVANLAEMAVYEVGGNALLVRTGALFHDVGKLDAPIYFVENQLSGMNPHDDMPFEESAAVIIGHVKKGLQLARKHDIPESVADFIRTHHGTSTVGYFYRNFLKQYPEREADRAKFTYPGPRPWTKEMAILMMADSVEAASRSLRVYDQETITQLVDRIMDHQMAEGQYDDADITLAEIGRIRKLFKAKLLNIYHVRTEYPD
jgi:putative nucleotidyltransferase with HDIG domain